MTEFGNDCFAVSGIAHSIASVNEVPGMAENYHNGLQMMLIGR